MNVIYKLGAISRMQNALNYRKQSPNPDSRHHKKKTEKKLIKHALIVEK